MRVLAVDPGYGRMGIAVMERCDSVDRLLFSTCIETHSKKPFPERLFVIGTELEQLFERYTPDTVAVETLFFNKNQKTAGGVLQARGVVLYLGEKYNCVVHEFGPQEIKIAVTGFGGGDKRSVFEMLPRLIDDIPERAHDDEYDAIAAGITCLAHKNMFEHSQ